MNNSSRNYYIHIIGCLISRLTDNPLESTPTARLRHFYTVPANRATKRPWFKLLHFTHSKPPNRRTRASRPCASNASHLRVLFERMFRLRFRPLCRRRTCPLHGTMLLYNVLVRLCARVNWFFFSRPPVACATGKHAREFTSVVCLCSETQSFRPFSEAVACESQRWRGQLQNLCKNFAISFWYVCMCVSVVAVVLKFISLCVSVCLFVSIIQKV